MLLGAHLSTAGGLHTAFDRAAETGCDTFQIFTKNKGAWAARPLEPEDIRAFRDKARSSRAAPVVAHAAYLINLASAAAPLRRKSVEALRVELERCETLGIAFLVLHPGSHGDATAAAGLERVARSLDQVHRETAGFKSRILLESAAGQGSSLCRTFGEIGAVLDRVSDPDRLGVCLDTCHLLAAGYELRTRDGYEATMAELEREVGSSRVRCIHINDSKKELGSRVDRHEHIGRGCFGRDGLRWILHDRRFRAVPFIFELPPEGDMVRKNLAALRRLAAARVKRGSSRAPAAGSPRR